MKQYGFNDVIWALALGLIISNVFGKPKWLVPALQTELFIKTGLVVMGLSFYSTGSWSLAATDWSGLAWLSPRIVLDVSIRDPVPENEG